METTKDQVQELHDVEPTEEEMKQWEIVKELMLGNDSRDSSVRSTIPIPYAFVAYAVNVAGVVYIKDRLEDSYTDGAFVGVIVGSYHLDRNNSEASGSNGLLKITLRLDIPGRTLYWMGCVRSWTGKWKCTGWNKVISF